MQVTPPKLEVSGNSAHDNSIQNNLLFKDCYVNITTRQREMAIESYMSLPGQEDYPNQEARKYLSSLFDGKAKEKPSYCHRDGLCLPGQNMLTHHIVEEPASSQSVLEKLSLENYETLKGWMRGADNQVLRVIQTGGDGTSTTELALDILRSNPKDQKIHFTGHLCGRDFDDKKNRLQEIMIKDLIGQLVDAYKNRFEGTHLCSLPKSDARNTDIRELWKLFTECVKKAEIKRLIIIIDRIDYILNNDFTEIHFKEFLQILETAFKTLHEAGVVVKLMTTSWQTRMDAEFEVFKALRMLEYSL